MEELVANKFSAEKWKESLKKAGISENRMFNTMEDVPDTEVLAIMRGICVAASLSMDQVTEAFGDYWSTEYAPSVYQVYFTKAKCAREFLLNLDQIHTAMTKRIQSARPPHFRYEWQGDEHLIMYYTSDRALVALMPGLVRGVAKYYKEKLTVSVAGNAVHVQFA
jgi:hypothetical protein